MAIPYPSELKQCFGTSRNEVTTVVSDFSDQGQIHARVFHTKSTYDLKLVHTEVTQALFDISESFWEANRADVVEVVWIGDGVTYEGVISAPPRVEYVEYQRFNIEVTLRVKKQ